MGRRQKVRALGAEPEGLLPAEAQVRRGTAASQRAGEGKRWEICDSLLEEMLVLCDLVLSLTLWNLISLSKLPPGANAGEMESKMQKHIHGITIT